MNMKAVQIFSENCDLNIYKVFSIFWCIHQKQVSNKIISFVYNSNKMLNFFKPENNRTYG
jgi:hypothetical protein